jgi:hypothetical protein
MIGTESVSAARKAPLNRCKRLPISSEPAVQSAEKEPTAPVKVRSARTSLLTSAFFLPFPLQVSLKKANSAAQKITFEKTPVQPTARQGKHCEYDQSSIARDL